MIKKIFLFIFCGLVLGVLVAERHPVVKNAVGDRFKAIFETTFNCTMQYRVESVSLFRLSLVLADVTVTPRGHENWQWHADTYSTMLSWRDLIFAGMLSMTIRLDNVDARSHMPHHKPAILDHVRLLLGGPSLTLTTCIKSLQLHKLTLSAQDVHDPVAVFLAADVSMGRVQNVVTVRCAVSDAHASYGNLALLTSAQGTLQMQSYDSATKPDIIGAISCACCIPQLPSVTNIVGNWEHDHGVLKLSTHDGMVSIDSCSFAATENGIQVSGNAQADIKALCSLFSYTCPGSLEAVAKISAHAHIGGQGIYDVGGQACVDAIRYAGTSLGSGNLSFVYQGQAIQGTVNIEGQVPLDGEYSLDIKKRAGSCALHSVQEHAIPLTQWKIDKNASLKLAYDPVNLIKGSYRWRLAHAVTQKEILCKGAITCDGTLLGVEGMVGSRPCALQATFVPYPCITHLTYGDAQTPLVSLDKVADSPLQMKGSCDVALLKELAALWDYQLHGQGVVDVTTTYLDKIITTSISLRDGAIQLPKLYNCVSGLQARIVADIQARKISLSNARCLFHKGMLSCADAQLTFDDTYHLVSVDLPLVLTSWLLATAGGFSATLSGDITYRQDPGHMPSVAGKVVIEQAHAQENIFSQGFLQRIRGSIGSMRPADIPEVACSLDISTSAPFHVNTQFLQTDAHLTMHVRNRISAPEFSGSIELVGGQLLFPYKPLYIRKGALYFVAGASLDPLIELVAQNTIKGHEVRLQVTGSLASPSLIFESNPSLTEPQVAALLVAGCADASLNSIAPALVMSNITSLLVDNIQSSQTLSRYLGALLSPLKNIRIIPRFSDQEARGGIRTALEVDVGDRWRALIQKNLSLTEDTKLELEYLVSDDISIKGTRNERGDVIGEVEVRYGF